jgi:hypothetical protein
VLGFACFISFSLSPARGMQKRATRPHRVLFPPSTPPAPHVRSVVSAPHLHRRQFWQSMMRFNLRSAPFRSKFVTPSSCIRHPPSAPRFAEERNELLATRTREKFHHVLAVPETFG